jgi:hypothetical protein
MHWTSRTALLLALVVFIPGPARCERARRLYSSPGAVTYGTAAEASIYTSRNPVPVDLLRYVGTTQDGISIFGTPKVRMTSKGEVVETNIPRRSGPGGRAAAAARSRRPRQ